jgi:hypothetical protein
MRARRVLPNGVHSTARGNVFSWCTAYSLRYVLVPGLLLRHLRPPTRLYVLCDAQCPSPLLIGRC